MSNDHGGYNLATARSDKQKQQMQELQARAVCAFCPENIETEQKEPIELTTKHWLVKKNDYPYEQTKLHLLIIPKEHVATLGHLSQEALLEMPEVIVAVEKQWQLTHYAVGIRSGDMHRTGGSVEHLHGHIVVGDTDEPNHEPVRFKMSSKPAA